MAPISAFRAMQDFFTFFLEIELKCIAPYQLYNSQGLLNLRRSLRVAPSVATLRANVTLKVVRN